MAMAKSGPLWALTIAEIGHDYGLYTMVTDLPKYMSDVMHFDITSVSGTADMINSLNEIKCSLKRNLIINFRMGCSRLFPTW